MALTVFALAALLPGVGLLCDLATDVSLGTRVELAAGAAPLVPGGDAEPAASVEVTGIAELVRRSEISRLALRYDPRAYYRAPNLLGVQRPLVLHRASIDMENALSERTNTTLTVGASYGEVDYTNAGLALTTAGNAAVQTSVLYLLSVNGQSGLAWQAARNYRLGVTFGGSFTKPISDDDSGGLAETAQLEAGANQTWTLSVTDQLALPIGVARFVSDPGLDYWGTTADLIWTHRLDVPSTISLGGGVWLLVSDDGSRSVLPSGRVTYQRTFEDDGLNEQLRASFLTSVFLDPVLGDLRPIAGADLSWERQLNRELDARAGSTARTSLTSDPIGPDVPETMLAGSASLLWRVSLPFAFEFGTRGDVRLPHLSSEQRIYDWQAWAFVGFSAIATTAYETDSTP